MVGEKDPFNRAKFIPLERIKVAEGDVLRGIKSTCKSFKGFGEIYFSWIKVDRVKAWKKHSIMTMNLIVPFGNVNFNLYCEESKRTKKFAIGESNYGRLVIPPGVWFGFSCIGSKDALIVNVADVVHDPKEGSRHPPEFFPFF